MKKLLFLWYMFCLVHYISTINANNPCSSFGEYSYDQLHITVEHWNNHDIHYSVGKFCSIAGNVTICLGGNHRLDWITTYPFPSFITKFPQASGVGSCETTKGNVTIGNDVWIGSYVKILSGVTIGDGAVIGAYSVVAKSIPPYAVVVGNPARVIRYRFDEKTIAALLKIQWWNWPIEKIKENVPLLCSANLEQFIEVHQTEIRE